MKLNKSAQRVAAAGRYGDSILMHVHPDEVHALSGLAALAGRQITTNPYTGMPEAFSLGDLIPYIAPIIGGMVAGPLGAGAASGLASYAATGDAQKALLSGVTGAAMGSMMSGITGAGGAGADAATQGAVQGSGDAAAQGAGSAAVNGSLDSAAIPGVVDYSSAAATGVPATAATSAPSAGISGLSSQATAPSTWSQKLDAMQNAKWTGNNSVLQNADGSLKMAPIIAGGGMLGLAGLSSQQAALDDYSKQQERMSADGKRKYDYYQSMVGKMPANMIPAYPG